MEYKFNWDNGVFAVPDCVADGLKLASGKAMKVIMYMLRFKTDEGICEYLGISEEDLEDSLSFWEQIGVIHKGDNPISVVSVQPPVQTAASAAENISAVIQPRPAKALTGDEIAARVNESEEIRLLCSSVEGTLGRILTFDDQRTLIWIHDHLGLKAEVILMMVNYCTAIGKSNMHYIEKAAVTWSEEGIDDSQKADNKIRILQRNHTLASRCISRMNLNRQLTKKENEIVGSWADADADIELIMNAYDRTVNSTGKVSFPYMNKIMAEWIANGIKTPEEADEYAARNAPKKSSRQGGKNKKSDEKPSFDLDLIMEHAKNTSLIS